MNYNNIQAPLDPPEDTRRVVYSCAICEEPIREGDDCFNIPDYGHVCEECISDCKEYEVEVRD